MRLLSLSARFDAVVSSVLMGMSLANITESAVLQRHVEVRVEDDPDVWVSSSLSGTVLGDVKGTLMRPASEVMRLLKELPAVGRTDGESGRNDA